ncbi:hypothetical protein [Pedobacter cryotolerans]|uniref:Sensor of ECF-type sigma factor n=1 Tax=Pedobacter cryotolerans TaxID=2571270 RepID=A0A4U1BVE8_9SPHI|nr:hypothetical protein [Pedobacter cryotolerans]TKB96473.1 hypothetical protein FA045_18095 [Pedobacter cryotolerans]
MKNLILALFILFPAMVFAQGSRPGDDKIEAAKIAFFTQKLDLTTNEAKIFWPIYNDYQKELWALRRDRHKSMISFRKVTEIDDLSDSQVQNLIAGDFDFRQKDLNIEKKYYAKFKASGLSIKQIGKFYRAQEAFKKELLSRFRGGQNKQ